MSSSSSSSPGSTTVIVGLNGALQKRFVLGGNANLVPGNVHRAAQIQTGIGGKGQDVAISLACLDFPDMQLAQFVGSGPEGDTVLQLLKDRIGGEAATALSLRTKSPMRTCTTIVASDESTELVEPSGIVTDEEKEEFLEQLKSSCGSPIAAICIMGSMPPGLPEDMYASMYETMAAASSSSTAPLCVIDSVVGLDTMLSAIAKTKGPAILKINASELCKLAGVAKSSSEAGGIALDELVEAVDTFMEKYSAVLDGLALTDGKHPAHLVSFTDDDGSRDIYKITVPSLDPTAVLYPIGAGDSVAAGTLGAWKSLVEQGDEKKKSLSDKIHAALDSRLQSSAAEIMSSSEHTKRMEAAFAFGLSCGSASCLEEDNSVFAVDRVLKLFQEIPPPELVSSKKN
eukprot:CAMPEP_0119003460 /NCGR_PEP_ID=MMETSP1176-20130426/575_1 /TAXON_ID=265551 /ORGANISM="Synedropsis recta cf, Strain CCMP1620" /LENGTH=399 /DNA_ID=CAMNT_0006955065 /DNA_START=77 /DNA_END=1276 /DNA_ORIENTATION=-